MMAGPATTLSLPEKRRPHMSDLERARDRIDDLEEELRQAREMLVPTLLFPMRCRLTQQQITILSYLLARSPAPKSAEQIIEVISMMDGRSPVRKVVDVRICQLRKILTREGIVIHTRFGQGYFLDRESADRLKELCAREARGEETDDARSVIIFGSPFFKQPEHFEHAGTIACPNQLRKLMRFLHEEGLKRWPQMVREEFDGYLRSVLR